MPRFLSDPALLECPDYASAIFAASRAPFINPNVTEAQAVRVFRS